MTARRVDKNQVNGAKARRTRANSLEKGQRVGRVGTVSGAAFGADQLRALGLRLRHLRELRTWSLKHLAAKSGVSVATIQKIEVGATNSSLLTVSALCEALGEPMDRLVRMSQAESRTRKLVHVAIPRRLTHDMSLTGDLAGAQMKGRVLIVPAEGKLLFSPDPASGPLFAYVLSGKLGIAFVDGVIEKLASGDAVHLSVSEHMTWMNPDKVDALVLCITDTRRHPDMDGIGEFE